MEAHVHIPEDLDAPAMDHLPLQHERAWLRAQPGDDKGQQRVPSSIGPTNTLPPFPSAEAASALISHRAQCKRKSSIMDFFAKSSKTPSSNSDSLPEPSTSHQDAAVSNSGRSMSSEIHVPAYPQTEAVLVTHDEVAVLQKDTLLPECWDLNQWAQFKEKYPWLRVENGLLGCTICSEVKLLGVSLSQGVSISKEWVSGNIAPCGTTKASKLTSLRKKMHKHRVSEAHMKACTIQAESKKEVLRSAIVEQQKHCFASTVKVFRTFYFCAKNNRPFLDFPDLIRLQVANEADMGSILHSQYTAAQIADCIASEMRRKLCSIIVEWAPKMSIFIDESTTVSSHSVLIVYIRSSIGGKEPITFFLDLLELAGGDAQSIEASLLNCLSKHGFCHEFLAENLIGVCSDGASVMLGRNSGVLERLAEKYPCIVKWHCLCHRIELSVSDTVQTVPGLKHLTSFFEKLYAVYHQSPKNQRELSECAKDLEAQILRIGKIFSIRWIASSQRAIRAVWESYLALHNHFLRASACISRDSKHRATFIGLNKIMTSEDFLLNLDAIADAVSEVGVLSEALQRDDVTLPRAYQLINRTVRAIERYKSVPGKHLKEVNDSIQNGSFKGVTINQEESRGQVRINLPQFYQNLADNLRSRLYAMTASNRSTNSSWADEFETLVAQIDVLNSQKWPSNIDSPWLEGEHKLEILCRRFSLNYNSIGEGFRDYIDNGGDEVPKQLQPIMRAVNTLPVTSSDCERGFSTMNLILSPVRNTLSISRLSSLMFINLMGPPLPLWDPLPYVNRWLSSHRNADDNQSRKVDPATHYNKRYADVWEFL